MPSDTGKHGPEDCTVYQTYCPYHEFVHGGEAEELRSGIEGIVAQLDDDDPAAQMLNDLLDEVDARDSLAWLEAKSLRRRKVTP